MWQQNIETPLGTMIAAWSEVGLFSFQFGNQTPQGAELNGAVLPWPASIRRRANMLTTQIEAYFNTGALEWSPEEVDWRGVSEFERKVLRHCAAIRTGQVMTYGQLAAKAGSPGATRAVGGCMARNRWPILIPCHRVVGSNGKMTGYSGRGGTKTKRWLLEFEQDSRLLLRKSSASPIASC
jgi:methylated-DNA-[protein]-cysteine S-methyltransferase